VPIASGLDSIFNIFAQSTIHLCVPSFDPQSVQRKVRQKA
jgi:hypothetical protein